MYLYYDRYGTLKEQITFNPARVGNSNVNKIFVYWEGVEEFTDWAQELALQTRYLLQDNTQYPSATTFGFSAQPETAELPFDKNQDLKYFKYYKEYKFLTIDIPDEVLSYNGAVKSYIWVLNADKKRILGLGVFAFMVDGDINEVIPDENISLAQWNMISAQLGLLSGSVIDVTCDIETNTLKVYYANGLTAIRNLPPNGARPTISSDFLREMIFSTDAWVQDGEQGYYLALSSSQVGFTDDKFFIQLEEKGEYNSKQGGFVLSNNIFKGNDGSVLLYSAKPFDGRLLLVGGDLLKDLNLENGTGTGSLVQKRLKSDGVTWTTAKAYQGASTAFGGGTQAGRTEEEFNAYFWDSTKNVPLNNGGGKNSSGEILDNHGLTYKESYSFSVAEGEQTKALGRGSHSEGYYTETKEEYSHAEGWKTFSKGLASHAEGSQTSAIGKYSHAEGFGTSAKGNCSHSEGMSTVAIGEFSHVEGFSTRTLERYQHIEGMYNADNPNALHIVGNGTSENARKNAFEVLEDGRAKVQSAPTESDDVLRLNEFSALTQEQVDLLF